MSVSDEEWDVKEMIRANWKDEWWGVMGCDRCAHARGPNGSPCYSCPRWPYFIQNHLPGDPNPRSFANREKPEDPKGPEFKSVRGK